MTRGTRQAVLFLFAVALAMHLVRLLFWVPVPDELSYVRTATSLIGGQPLPDGGLYFSPPLFVYLLAVPIWLHVDPLLAVRLVAACFGAATVAACYILLRKAGVGAMAVVGALVALALFRLNLVSRVGLRETPHIFLAVSSFALLVGWAGNGLSRGSLVWAGILLGLALWFKSVAFLYIAAALLFIAVVWWHDRDRSLVADILLFGAGLLPPVAALLLHDGVTGSNLLVEVSTNRGYDVNMMTLSLFASFRMSLANLIADAGYALKPPSAKLGGLVLLATSAAAIAYGVFRRRPVATVACCYAVVALPFFTWFTRKLDYYMLPLALFVLLALVEALQERRAGWPMWHRSAQAVVGGVLCLTVAFNVVADAALYTTRGDDDIFRVELQTFAPGALVLVSHDDVAAYINDTEHLGLQVVPLFEAGSYQLNTSALLNPAAAGAITKDYYFDRLSVRAPEEWARLERAFPFARRAFGVIVFRRTAR